MIPTMSRVRKRIYLGNLPFDTTEEEVTGKFRKFGKVLNVEMKYQSDVSFDVGLPCYAFLDLDISDNDLNSCFSKIKAKNWRGNIIKIEIAKESFLSRLERERKNDSHLAENTVASPLHSTKLNSEVETKKGSHIKFEENEDIGDKKQPTIDEDPNILKKRKKPKKSREPLEHTSTTETLEESVVLDKFESFSNVWQDEPSHEPTCAQKTEKREKERKKKKEKCNHLEIIDTEEMSIEERNKISEERRLKSLANREKSMKQQKDAVKLALSSVDSNKSNNKLKFKYDDDEDDEPAFHVGDQTKKSKPSHQTHKKPGLFPDHNSSDDDEEAFTFAVKKQFEGKKGQRLLNLKSKYGNDERFVLDERFYDGEEENDEVSADVSTSDEVQRQLEILKGIVGENLPRGPRRVEGQTQKPGQNFMLRFDPTVADHRQFEISKDEKSKALVNERKEKNKRKREMEAPTVEVSKDKYYKVADSLKESLKTTEGGGFSLLQMFGERNDVESDEDHMETEALSTDWKEQKSKQSQLDNVDSTTKKEQEKFSAAVEHAPIVASWGETFFFKSDDPRLFEGIKFVKTQSECQDFRELRYELRDICRHKLDAARKRARESRSSFGNRGFRGASRGATRGHRGRH